MKRTKDTEAAIQAAIVPIVMDLEGIRRRILALRARAEALPGHAEAEAVNDRSGNLDRMTLALRIAHDLSAAAEWDDNGIDATLRSLGQAAAATQAECDQWTAEEAAQRQARREKRRRSARRLGRLLGLFPSRARQRAQ